MQGCGVGDGGIIVQPESESGKKVLTSTPIPFKYSKSNIFHIEFYILSGM